VSVVLVVLIGVVALILAARSARRAWSDRRSLEEHHKALGTLGEIAHHQDPSTPVSFDQPPRFHVRVVSPDEVPPPSEPPRRPPVVKPWVVFEPEAGAERAAGAEPPVAAPPPSAVAPPPSTAVQRPSTDGRPSTPAPDWTAPAPAPRLSFGHAGEDPEAITWEPPPLVPASGPVPTPIKPPPTPPEVAAALVAETVSAPVAARRGGHARQPSGARRALLAAVGAVAAAIVVVALALAMTGGSPDRRAGLAGSRAAPLTTSTLPPVASSPPPPAAVLVASDNQGATFSLSSQVRIELVPSSNCWVQVRLGSATGSVVYEGLLRPGQPYPLPGTGPVWLRLGNPPGVSVVVNGTPLQAPLPSTSQPYNLEFQPASASGTSTSG
jgi:hypothetical protein